MKPKQFTLSNVKTTPTASLQLRYADGGQSDVSLVDTILQHPVLERLKDPEAFSSAKVGDHGAAVVFGLAGDTGRRVVFAEFEQQVGACGRHGRP